MTKKMVASTYEIVEKAATYKLLIDYHGVYKPTRLQRTYPNVIGFEGVQGMKNTKWARVTCRVAMYRLDGRVGEYVAIVRRKADTWYVGPMTNWTVRELTLDFSFPPKGNYEAEIFKDG